MRKVVLQSTKNWWWKSRCDFPARVSEGGTMGIRDLLVISFRRLTLRSAT
jgi:hypothetical protein